MKKICEHCGKERAGHFFAPSGICVPCAASNGERAIKTKKKKDYEVVDDRSCVGGACTL